MCGSGFNDPINKQIFYDKIEKKKRKKKGEILSHTDEEKRGVGGSRQATTATTPPLDISKLKPHAICFIK